MKILRHVFMSLLITETSIAVASAQSLAGLDMENIFRAQVKTLEEFISRFNGDASYPDVLNTGDSRAYNIVRLFDREIDHKEMSDSAFTRFVSEFVTTVEQCDVLIRLTDDDMYAEADISASVLGKDVSLKLFLQSQTYNKDKVRWAIVGVRGLFTLNVIDTTMFYGISPVEHEINFIGIGDIFRYNCQDIIAYRGGDARIDELSLFLGLAMAGKIEVKSVEELTFHCVEVPGWCFVIGEVAREGSNSGWLINDLVKITDSRKYIDNLLYE